MLADPTLFVDHKLYGPLAKALIEHRAAGGTFEVSIRVSNIGRVAGTDVVQLYLHDPVASIVRPVQRLIGFQRVTVPAGYHASGAPFCLIFVGRMWSEALLLVELIAVLRGTLPHEVLVEVGVGVHLEESVSMSEMKFSE